MEKTVSTTLSGKVLTGRDFVSAIVALFREKGCDSVSFDRRSYDRCLTKEELPWCILFDCFIDTVSAPALWSERAFSFLNAGERADLEAKGFPGSDVLSIGVDDDGLLLHSFFDGDENEAWERLFFDVYDEIRSDDDEEPDMWLDAFFSSSHIA